MATIKTLNPNTVTLTDIIAALAETKLTAEAKMQVITQAADETRIRNIAIYLNHYFADSVDEYVDDADAAIAAQEEAARKAEAKAKAEAEEKARKTRVMNAAAKNLALRGVEMFKDGQLNADYQKALNEEIGKLLKGERILVTSEGEYFVPDSTRSNMSQKQLEAMDKAELEAAKSDDIISLEDTRPMEDGQHEVVISYYREKLGRNGQPNYAVVQVQEVSTGKRAWLPKWMLASVHAVDPRDAWRTRYMSLKTIALNNYGLGEHMREEQAVELLREKPFSIFVLNRGDERQVVYLDREQYTKALRRERIAAELREEREFQQGERRAMGFDEDAQNESIEAKSYKF